MQKNNKTIQKIINFNDVMKEETEEHNSNWPKLLIKHTDY